MLHWFPIGKQICANTAGENKRAGRQTRTINNPKTFPLAILTQRVEKQVLLAVGIACRWWWGCRFSFLVLIVYHTPRTVNESFNLCAMGEL
jgi:hypothetical protein